MNDQQWERLGRILVPDPKIWWLHSHAGASFAVPSRAVDDRFEIFVSGRDERNRSMIGRVHLAMDPDPRIVEIEAEPVLTPGSLGAFDENGVSYPCIFEHAGRRHLLYTGWMPTVLTPFQNQIGLAQETDRGRFERVSRAPILPRVDEDHLSVGSSFLDVHEGQWKLWYTSFQGWERSSPDAKPQHHYLIKFAHAKPNGPWQRGQRVCIGPASANETSICRPSVIRHQGRYHMWYCFRGKHYRIGYASSENGVEWARQDDQVKFLNDPDDWDRQEQCYPHVFRHRNSIYMLYSGNGYGRDGLGIARLVHQSV